MKITRESLIMIGFRELPTPSIGNSLIFRLPFDRHISASSIGTPNEMVCICQREYKSERRITDVITLRSYDYHGYCEQSDIEQLIKLLNVTK